MANQQENSMKTEHHGNCHIIVKESGEKLHLYKKPSESTVPASFDGLIFDCLEMIFERLDLKSLLNVAGTCKRLNIEAASFFNAKFDKKNVVLYHNLKHSPYIYVAGKHSIYGLKQCLAFLRCFGAHFSDLKVQWQTWTAYKLMNPLLIPNCICHTSIDTYINQYCGESLVTILFYDKSGFSSENYVKPFKNVETVRLMHCGLARNLPYFIYWFPNLRHLDINASCDHQLSTDMELHFPNLQHLTIKIFKNDQHKLAVKKLLHMNPQLSSLEILSSVRVSMTELLDMIDGNPSILKLLTLSGFCGEVNTCESRRLAIEHSLMAELDIGGYKFKAADAINLIRQLNLLEKFQIEFQTNKDRNQFLYQVTNEWQYEKLNRFAIKLDC